MAGKLLSAAGRLGALALMVVFFGAGMAGVVYMSLQGTEIKVPEITGKNFADSERELAALGLKIKKRADRPSQDPPNTVIEQLPKPGETVKTGQMILVVTSKAPAAGEEAPPALKKPTDDNDADKIEEMITDKPKKPKSNTSSTKKKPDTTRDVNSSNNSSESNSNKKETGGNNSSDKGNKNTSPPVTHPPANTGRPVGNSRPKASNKP